MHVTEWNGFCKIVGLVKAGLPLSAIIDPYGRAVHCEAQTFTRSERWIKIHLIRALVTSWRNSNFSEVERIASDGQKKEAAGNGAVRTEERQRKAAHKNKNSIPH